MAPHGLECADRVSVGEIAAASGRRARLSRAWNTFRTNRKLRRDYALAPEEIDIISQVGLMGDVHTPSDFVFILKTLRSAFKS